MDVNFPSYLEFVPMLWGTAPAKTNNWNKNVQNAISRGTKAVLAFNEPDACGSGQSCLTPQAAATAYLTYVQPFAGLVELGGLAVTEAGTAVRPYCGNFRVMLTYASGCSNSFFCVPIALSSLFPYIFITVQRILHITRII